jgi:hypothetical protein
MSGLRVFGALLIFIGGTFAVFTAVVAIDRIYAHGSIGHGRAIAWLIGGGIYTMIVGAVLVILDAGARHER